MQPVCSVCLYSSWITVYYYRAASFRRGSVVIFCGIFWKYSTYINIYLKKTVKPIKIYLYLNCVDFVFLFFCVILSPTCRSFFVICDDLVYLGKWINNNKAFISASFSFFLFNPSLSFSQSPLSCLDVLCKSFFYYYYYYCKMKVLFLVVINLVTEMFPCIKLLCKEHSNQLITFLFYFIIFWWISHFTHHFSIYTPPTNPHSGLSSLECILSEGGWECGWNHLNIILIITYI